MNTRSIPRLRERRRAAVQLASGHVIYSALRFSSSCREMTDRDRVILALGRHAAEPLYGFEVDFDALISCDLPEAFRVGRSLRRERGGGTHRGQATEYLRRLWTKAGRYLSRPDVKGVLDKLVGEACSSEQSVEGDLSLLAEWQRRWLRFPDFDGTVTRAAERDRKLMIEATRRELAELTRAALICQSKVDRLTHRAKVVP